ncbi:MAG: glucoamylase family protein [Bdellovibrio sp.]
MELEEEKNHLPNLNPQGTDYEMLGLLLRETFDYFVEKVNPKTGLVADKTAPGSPASIAVIGLALSIYIVGVERKFLTRAEAIERTVHVLRFFYHSPQGPEPDATGYKGFYYHFLDMETGRRVWNCEISTIDTALLMAGVISAANYFTEENEAEKEIRDLANKLYERVDWQWALNGGATLCHGWKPSEGFLPYRWNLYYSEAHILYVLALASPSFPISKEGYVEWSTTFEWKKVYGMEYIYAGPLFIHQLSQIWLDFRGIHDDVNRKYGIDYFENSRRATVIHQKYAIKNPRGFAHYGKNAWGFTASAGPGPTSAKLGNKNVKFYGYMARGAPFGPDDGTISPWAAVASFPFAPRIVCSTVRYAIEKFDLKSHLNYGFEASFNPTFPNKVRHHMGWISPWQYGLNQGPIILMIENGYSQLIWKVMKNSPIIRKGLLAAGFQGGWLERHR